MPRPLVLGNGNILVALDDELSIRDFTYPYVGLLNHLNGHRIRIGIWCDGRFAWIADPSWSRDLRYEPDTLVTRATCAHQGMALEIVLSDCVLHRQNALLRRFEVRNTSAHARQVRIFLCHDFYLAETDIGDTAFYNPYTDSLIHYKRDNYFLISGTTPEQGIYQYTTGIKGFKGAEGAWRDAEDGALSMHPVEQGSVDSAVSFHLEVPPNSARIARSWICVGRSMAEISALHAAVSGEGFEAAMEQTRNYWVAWTCNQSQSARLEALPAALAQLFRRSLLTMRTQIDNRGAIIAANDSDIMETARAHYSYMWPRDGALVAHALDRLGYQDITRRFFLFCRRVLPHDRAALMHKYSADGSWGATWHPWTVDGRSEVPFQQDSTALVLWSLWQHYCRNQDLEFVETLYRDLVVPAADFAVSYRDPDTGLPMPSYDLWEERRGVNTYTCGTLYGALHAAAEFARLFHDPRAVTYAAAAEELKTAIEEHLWDSEVSRFVRRVVVHADGTLERDLTIDAAVYALFAFGAFPVTDPRIESTMRQTLSRLWVQTETGGLARYENDYYFRRSDDLERVPGNPWIICTLWAAQYYILHAQCLRDLETPMGLLMWVVNHAASSGILPEQIHPYTGQHLSVAPLTWSHAELVSTALLYLDRQEELGKLEEPEA